MRAMSPDVAAARGALYAFANMSLDQLLATTNVFYRQFPQMAAPDRAAMIAAGATGLSTDQLAFLLGVALLRLAEDGSGG